MWWPDIGYIQFCSIATMSKGDYGRTIAGSMNSVTQLQYMLWRYSPCNLVKVHYQSWLLKHRDVYFLQTFSSPTSTGVRVSGCMLKYLQGQQSIKPQQCVMEEEKTQLILFICFHCFCSSWKIMSFQISFDISMMLNRFGEITNILTGFLGNETFMKLICHELIWLI